MVTKETDKAFDELKHIMNKSQEFPADEGLKVDITTYRTKVDGV